MSVELDKREWQAALRQLWPESSQALQDFINGKAVHLVNEAIKQTEKANAERIAWQLGRIGYSRKRHKKTGEWRKFTKKTENMLVAEDSFAERILAVRFKKTGEWGVKGSTMAERVQRFIAASMRSVAFIKSGWIPAQNALWAAVKKKTGRERKTIGDAKQYGKQKGSAKPAIFSWFREVAAEAVNTAMRAKVRPPSTAGNPLPVAERGLAKAYQICRADMLKHLKEKLEPAFKKFSAK